MNTEDDEFNRIEMESHVRQEYVRQQLKKQHQENLLKLNKEEIEALDSYDPGVELKLKNHEALEAVLKGYATRDHIDVLIAAFNVSEALYYVNPDLGEDWAEEIRAAQDAIFTMSRRGLDFGKFLFTGSEMSAVKLAMSVHNQQLDDCTVRQLEEALSYVAIRVKNKQARAIVEEA